jgi:hypothetical protein
MASIHPASRALRPLILAVPLLLISALAVQPGATPLTEEAVPELLRPWVGWALWGQESRRCPFVHRDHDQKRCLWPDVLEIRVDVSGVSFSQNWRLFTEGFIPLPGDPSLWPQEVRLDGIPTTVSSGDAAPRVRASAGAHSVTGRLPFDRAPEFVRIPVQTGLVTLEISGRKVEPPELDDQGRLWLSADAARREGAPEVKNTLEIRVFRQIVDGIPLTVSSRIELDVSGEHREVLLGPVLVVDAIPLSLNSGLPARLEPDGRLRVQVRPGRHVLTLSSRRPGPTTALARSGASAPWPGTEIWVFSARNDLRLVEIEGVPSVDPRQTSLPPEWQNLPAYRVEASDTFRMVVKRRGDPEPQADRLHLSRTLWLDFDGGGYSVSDLIEGQLSASWRLEAEPVLDLGRAAVDGEAWFITRRSGSQLKGVELRRGDLSLSADARVEPRSALPALGWDHDFQSVRATLNLPPGWRLFSAAGVDRVDHTWVSRWTLFDLFLLLVTAAVAGKLWGWKWGVVALLAIGLVFHEYGAPKQVWLHIFAATALLSVLPKGKFARWVGIYRYLALGALLIIFIPFAVDQVRVALFPQLEQPWQAQPAGVQAPDRAAPKGEARRPRAPSARSPMAESFEDKPAEMLQGAISSIRQTYYADELSRVDPKANIQTGPGLPRWQWLGVELVWNGPVSRGQPLDLVLLSPGVNLMLRLLSVALLALLAARALLVGVKGRMVIGRSAGGAAAVMLAGALLTGVADPANAAEVSPSPVGGEIPGPAMLEELRQRLLEAPDCVPGCAALPRMRLEAAGESFSARMEVHAQAQVAIPLPGRHGAWLPQRVQLDGFDAEGVFRDDEGKLWVALEPGVHQLVVSGRLPARERVEIALPLKPFRVEASAEGWEIDGIHENGVVGEQIQLRRISVEASRPEALEPGALPPFVRVERTLLLGLEWRVVTRVSRASPPGSAVVLEVPLIRGEAVTSEGLRVENDRVQVSLAANATQVSWESVLEQRAEMTLLAPEVNTWTEVWQLNASPIWHVESSGIPVIHQQQRGHRFPRWQPWPGERVSLRVSRPEGVEGRTLTIDMSSLTLKPGRRATDVDLSFEVRSSQGVQHPVTLPPDADLQSVKIDGRSQPIRQENGVVSLPLEPGKHQVALSWRSADGISALFTTPAVNLGAPSVNASTQMEMPRSRWVLLSGGPSLGPAVMFWGLLIVIVGLAVGLGRSGRTPLKARHWLLLGVGLSQVPVYLSILVVGWLFALDARGRLKAELPVWQFNLMQAGLALLTLVALAVLFFAVKQGLLGLPDMQIAGNGSRGYLLRWFEDRADAVAWHAWVLSVPLAVYRLLMLAWALWIAFALLRWLRWSWEAFSSGGYWRSMVLRRPKRVKTLSTDSSEDEPKS